MESEVTSIMTEATSADQHFPTKSIKYQTGFFRQLDILSERAMKNLIRNPMVLYFNIFASVVMGGTADLVYFDLDSSYTRGIQNR